jgi:dipeptidase E
VRPGFFFAAPLSIPHPAGRRSLTGPSAGLRKGIMKLLLTSAGVRNPGIRRALLGLLGKPIADAHALCIPTALYGHPQGTPDKSWRFIAGQAGTPMCELGWKSVGVLELTALPSVPRERWVPWVRAADVLLVNGGDALYLCHWMRQSGLAELLPALRDTVWVGLSAGSMVMTPRVGADFVETKPPITGDDRALGVVDFSIFPHLDHPAMPENSLAAARRWAAGLGHPAYAIDDETAIQVADGRVEVVSEGHWEHFALTAPAATPPGRGDSAAPRG